jgi:hypothetical protein
MATVVEINKGFTHRSSLAVDQGIFYGKIYAPDAQELDLSGQSGNARVNQHARSLYSIPKEVVVDNKRFDG